MIHYHGLPITPETAAAVVLSGGHGFVSFREYSAPQYVYQSGEWQALSAEPKQHAGAAEVSDEQIDSILWIGERATPEKLRMFARKVLALKAGGVA